MPFFNLDSFIKDTTSGLNQTVFNVLSASGQYFYTSSIFNIEYPEFDTGSANIKMEFIRSNPTLPIEASGYGTGSLGTTVTMSSGEEVIGYGFISSYPYVYSPYNLSDSSSISTIFYESSSLPLNQ
jgi:hypothetical protein